MKKIIVQYGADRIEKQRHCQFTVGELKNDSEIQTGLGFGDNINVLVAGVIQPDSAVIPDGSVVKVETAANKKAA